MRLLCGLRSNYYIHLYLIFLFSLNEDLISITIYLITFITLSLFREPISI